MALVQFQGGGCARGSKNTLAAQVKPITARGYVSITAQYRLSGVAKWPSQIEDAETHIRWVRANASSLGIDPQRIAIVGHSAGKCRNEVRNRRLCQPRHLFQPRYSTRST